MTKKMTITYPDAGTARLAAQRFNEAPSLYVVGITGNGDTLEIEFEYWSISERFRAPVRRIRDSLVHLVARFAAPEPTVSR